MAANMLVAYYSRGCDSRELFAPFKIAQADSFEKHLNQYNVIRLNMTRVLKGKLGIEEMLERLELLIMDELQKERSDFQLPRFPSLDSALEEYFQQYHIPFVFIIDEWDCLFRMKQFSADDQITYLNFLRNLLKDQSYVALAYMTGILPIKKYGEHSALNMFTEISMTYAEPYSEFTGFTESEVTALCEQYHRDFDTTKQWYDGYCVDGVEIYNPRSVVESILRGMIQNYWNATETYKALQDYIKMNFDDLREKGIRHDRW